MRKTCRILVGEIVCLLLLVSSGVPNVGAVIVTRFLSGEFGCGPGFDRDRCLGLQQSAYLPSYSGPGYGEIAGRAQIASDKDGTATASVAVYGLPPGEHFEAFFYALPCDQLGGERYQNPACSGNPDYDAGESGACPSNEMNEIWLPIDTDASGRGLNEVTVPWKPDAADEKHGDLSRGFSFVVHDTPNNGGSGPGPKMLCASVGCASRPFGNNCLRAWPDAVRREMRATVGYAYPDADGNTYAMSFGKIKIARNGYSMVKINWRDLRPDFEYPTYVHSGPCTVVSDGGPRYARDITFAKDGTGAVPPDADGEFWVTFRSKGSGRGRSAGTIPEMIRADALSVVLHDCLDSGGAADPTGLCEGGTPRLVCLDFR